VRFERERVGGGVRLQLGYNDGCSMAEKSDVEVMYDKVVVKGSFRNVWADDMK